MITTCQCKHEGQDKLHGTAKRVFNPTSRKVPSGVEYRCTVCGRVKVQ